MMPTWVWSQDAFVGATVAVLVIACVWWWHRRLGAPPKLAALGSMSLGWMTQKHLHEHDR